MSSPAINRELYPGHGKSLVQVPDYLYLLESPDIQKLDGKYHGLKVTVSKQSVTIQGRKGFFAPKQDPI